MTAALACLIPVAISAAGIGLRLLLCPPYHWTHPEENDR